MLLGAGGRHEEWVLDDDRTAAILLKTVNPKTSYSMDAAFR